MSSSSASAFFFTPTRNSSSGIRRAPRTLATSTSAPSTSSGGSASPAGDAVPRFPPIVPRLRICGEPTVRDASASAGSASARSRCIASVYVSPAPSRSVPFSRDQPRSSSTSFRLRSSSGRARSKLSATIMSVPPWIGTRVRDAPPSVAAPRSSERGVRTSTTTFYRSSRTYGTPSAAGAPIAPLREAGRDEHQHDDRHHVREGVEELRRHLHIASLQRKRERRQRAEEVRAHETELRAPEREDDQRDGDPAGTADERVARAPTRQRSRGCSRLRQHRRMRPRRGRGRTGRAVTLMPIASADAGASPTARTFKPQRVRPR